jgi:hypothetical protein
VVVHDGEGSRIPWETLRVGDVHPALKGGLTRRYASETLTVRITGAGTVLYAGNPQVEQTITGAGSVRPVA